MATIKTTLSLTTNDREWMDAQIASGEFVSYSEFIRALIRRDKSVMREEKEWLRQKLIRSEKSKFVEFTREGLLAEFKADIKPQTKAS